jgi:type VI secretion system secreted protein Hcp
LDGVSKRAKGIYMALSGYMKVITANNKWLEGDCDLKEREKWIPIFGANHGVKLPTTANGLPNGSAQYLPIEILKQIDHTSPTFNQLLASGEILNEITIQWYKVDALTAQEIPYYSQTLKGVTVNMVSVSLQDAQDALLMERVSFMYEEITWLFHDGGIEYNKVLGGPSTSSISSAPANKPAPKAKPKKHKATITWEQINGASS